MAEPEAQGPSGPSEREAQSGLRWEMLLRVGALAAGGAVWVQLVGSVDMWTRYDSIGIAPTATVSLLPRDLLFASGVRTLAAPVILGIVAYVMLILLQVRRIKQTDGTYKLAMATTGTRNPPGRQPRGLKIILTFLAGGAIVLVLLTPIEPLAKMALAFVAVAAVSVIYVVVVCTEGFGSAAVALLVATALLGAIFGVARQIAAPPNLDIAVALRKDGTAIGGFFIGRTGDSVYLLTTAQPGGKENSEVGEEAGTAPVVTAECDTGDVAAKRDDCYVQQVVGIRESEVVKFAIGPSNIEVNADGYQAARVLAQVALLREDEEVRVGGALDGEPSGG